MLNWVRFFKKIFQAAKTRKDLDVIFKMTPKPEASLRSRIDWLLDLIQWVRSSGIVKSDLDFSSGIPQATRVKYALLVLEKNKEWKSNVAQALRSIIYDTEALELFLNAGIPKHSGMWSEAFERLQQSLLPEARNDRDLVAFFTQTFKHKSDAIWIKQIDSDIFAKLVELFNYDIELTARDSVQWNTLYKDAQKALILLSKEVTALGLHPWVRQRTVKDDFRKSPFYKLDFELERFLKTLEGVAHEFKTAEEFKKDIQACLLFLGEVYAHMDEYGISVSLVYHLDKTETLLKRMLTLIELLDSRENHAQQIQVFLGQLIEDNVKSRSLRAVFNDNLAMISRKISETSAESGEHYIARNKQEYTEMFYNALGGGALTAITTVFKFLIYNMPLAPFFLGLFSSLNYSLSFLGIQLFGMTLATKQPAMTAATLAEKMKDTTQQEEIEKLVEECIYLIKSQFIAVIGNILSVVPCLILIYIFFLKGFSVSLITEKEALKTLHSFSLFGMTPFYAAFTGVLLFSSSMIAGWVHNWMLYRRLPTALAYNRTLIFAVGPENARKFSLFVKKNTAGVAANISLGFLLGMTPFMASFMGLPLEVRHVTLSSGALAAAIMKLGIQQVVSYSFLWAVLGIIIMALLNIGVSFALASIVALRARKVDSTHRTLIYRALWKRIRASIENISYKGHID